ncbi:uncharacterized protein A4U43_C08F11220 [Asparagus officinalis]|nr:uncharacterized protein A4U43_C08F11220 [Asparagus officinalis]
MGRQGNDPTVFHSSIALLQERFRQLQRVKEMREERELLKGFAGTTTESDPHPPQPPKWFLHPDLVRPSRPLTGPPAHHRGERPEFRGEAEVDTSLHLGTVVLRCVN